MLAAPSPLSRAEPLFPIPHLPFFSSLTTVPWVSKRNPSRGAEIPPAPTLSGTRSGLPTISLSPLDATLMDIPASVECCKQKTYGLAKPFKCNTYKKHGVGGILPILERRETGTTKPQDFADCLSIPVRFPPRG